MDNVVVILNGREEVVSRGSTVVDALRRASIDPTRKGIAVAVNEQIVRRADWVNHEVVKGDRIDVIHATQGG